MARKVDTVARYFRRLASFAGNPADYDGILHPEFQVTEFPSVLNAALRTSVFQDCIKRVGEGRKLLSAQHFEITGHVESDILVAVEGKWNGLLAADYGGQKKGKALKARFCMIFEFKDEKIWRQRSYETSDPAAT